MCVRVSIVMAVYNAERYINECIQSIKEQTFSHFEVVIVNDGSTDRTSEILSSIDDSRFRIVNSNHDYIASLNKGLNLATGEYIARMDADDIMMPERIERQVAYMDDNPMIDVCASWYEGFGDFTWLGTYGKYMIKNPLLELLQQNIICHPTTMLKKSFLCRHNIFYKRYDYAEDYKMWVDVACAGGVFYVIPEVLLRYRCSTHQVSNIYNKRQRETAITVKNEILFQLLNNEKCRANSEIRDIYMHLEKLNSLGLLSAGDVRSIIRTIYLKLN